MYEGRKGAQLEKGIFVPVYGVTRDRVRGKEEGEGEEGRRARKASLKKEEEKGWSPSLERRQRGEEKG